MVFRKKNWSNYATHFYTCNFMSEIYKANELKPTWKNFYENWDSISEELKIPRNILGWRNEHYTVRIIGDDSLNSTGVFHLERALCKFIGIEHYGMHINCFTKIDNEIYLWIGKRSPTKETFPNLIDQCVAGNFHAKYYFLYSDKTTVKDGSAARTAVHSRIIKPN